MQIRGQRALDRLFGPGGAEETCTSRPHVYFDHTKLIRVDISITSHSAILRNILVVLGHQPYPLATGEMIPVVIKATRAALIE